MRKRFTITASDIGNGLRHNTQGCAVAESLKRLYGPSHEVSVITIDGVYHAMVYHVDSTFNGHPRIQPIRTVDSVWRLSQNAGRWIQTFDRGEGVKPSTFEMTLVGQ
jgi:hypothetical protein